MIRLALLGIRRPRLMLAVWGVVIGTLGFIGLGIEGELHRSDLSLAGSGSNAAQVLEAEEFGEGFTLSVLLTGPAAEVASQGRDLAARLADNDAVVVLSPWTKGADRALRPNSGQALLLLRVNRPFEEVSTTIAGQLRDQVDQVVAEPVTANLTGFPALANAIHGGTIDALQKAEVIAAPLLAVVLMFVFRSMVAASVPLLDGLCDHRRRHGRADHHQPVHRARRIGAEPDDGDGPGPGRRLLAADRVPVPGGARPGDRSHRGGSCGGPNGRGHRDLRRLGARRRRDRRSGGRARWGSGVGRFRSAGCSRHEHHLRAHRTPRRAHAARPQDRTRVPGARAQRPLVHCLRAWGRAPPDCRRGGGDRPAGSVHSGLRLDQRRSGSAQPLGRLA